MQSASLTVPICLKIHRIAYNVLKKITGSFEKAVPVSDCYNLLSMLSMLLHFAQNAACEYILKI